MTAIPTNAERKRSLPWWLAAGMLDNVRISFVFGPVLVLFLDALQFGRGQIGFLLALPLFFQVLAIFVVPMIERIGYKLSCIIFFGMRTTILLGLLFTPTVAAVHGTSGAFLWVAFVMLVFSFALVAGLTAAGPWSQEILPTNIRSKIIALNTFLCSLVVLTATCFAGFWIKRSDNLSGFMFLIGTGSIIGILSVICHGFFPGGGSIKRKGHSKEHFLNMLKAFKDKDFVGLLWGIAIFIFIVQGVASFIPLYMKDIIGIDAGDVIYLTMWTTAGTLIAVYFWGWAADRFGGKPVFVTGVMFHILMPFLWYAIPRNAGNASFYSAVVVSFIGGILCVAYLIGIDRYLFLTIFPPDKKTSYHSVWFAWTGFFAGMGPLAVGLALKFFHGLDASNISLLHIKVNSFLPIFAAHIIMPAIAIYVISKIKQDSETTAKTFVGQLFESVPFGLFGSLSSIMRYRWAGEEQERIETTRDLGRLDSPFNADELIEAIKDPSFDVRYEAIVAMASRKPSHRTVMALTDVLNGFDIELSATASWALGQIGDKEAIPALRNQLEAPYRILRARSARALAGLDDKEIAPHLHELLKTESDHALKTAYASALGTLKYMPALQDVLTLLSEAKNETFRGELALAVAKIIGSERTYIKLYRNAQSDWSTTVYEAMTKMKKPMQKLDLSEDLLELVTICADCFAAEKPSLSDELMWPIFEALQKDSIDKNFRPVFMELSKRLEQFGTSRREYILLAIHTCDVWLRTNIAIRTRDN
ncbi:MAG: MFS transporter [Planctomycetaceae bacterium]|nr:MFS transporter [Planctomycetaceae bacterium]